MTARAVWDALPSLSSLGPLGEHNKVWIVHTRCGGGEVEARLSVVRKKLGAQWTSVHCLFKNVSNAKAWLISEGLDWLPAKEGRQDSTILGNAV